MLFHCCSFQTINNLNNADKSVDMVDVLEGSSCETELCRAAIAIDMANGAAFQSALTDDATSSDGATRLNDAAGSNDSSRRNPERCMCSAWATMWCKLNPGMRT